MEKILSLSLEESNFTTPPLQSGEKPEVCVLLARSGAGDGVKCEAHVDAHVRLFGGYLLGRLFKKGACSFPSSRNRVHLSEILACANCGFNLVCGLPHSCRFAMIMFNPRRIALRFDTLIQVPVSTIFAPRALFDA